MKVTPDQSTLGSRVRTARHAAGLCQLELANQVGVRGRSVQYWEADQLAPRLRVLGKLARALAVDIGWLVTGNEPTTPNPNPERESTNEHESESVAD